MTNEERVIELQAASELALQNEIAAMHMTPAEVDAVAKSFYRMGFARGSAYGATKIVRETTKGEAA
jgi:hypothetical protein